MLTINWAKIDRYYFVLTLVLIVLAAIFVFTFRGISSSFITAYEIEPQIPDKELRVNKEQLDAAEVAVFSSEIIPLEIRD